MVIRATQGDVPPFLFAGARACLGGGVLLLVARSARRLRPPSWSWGWILLLAASNIALGLGGMFASVRQAGAALSGILANSQALVVAPLAALFFGEKLGIERLAALVIGVGGVVLLVSGASGSTGTWRDAVPGLAAGMGLAGGNLVIRHVGSRLNAMTATGWQYLLGGILLLALSTATEAPHRVRWSGSSIAGLLFLGVVVSAAASCVWYLLLRQGELISLNALTLSSPVFGLALAAAIDREPVSTSDLLGIVAVLAGITATAWPPFTRGSSMRRTPPRHQEALRIAAFAFVLNALWETLQCPYLYDMSGATLVQPALTMWGAVLGDVVAVAAIVGASARLAGTARIRPPHGLGWLVLATVGFAVGIGVEWAALGLGLWRYSPRMPTVALAGKAVGIVPLVQMAVLPAAAVALAARRRCQRQSP